MKVTLLSLISDFFETSELNKSKVLIGRAPNCDLVIDHQSVSHYHCILFQEPDGRLQILDLYSCNGTYINGNKINKKYFISEGDSLSFGSVHASLVNTNKSIIVENIEAETKITESADKVYIPQKDSINEVLIDNEYCDIIFNEEEFTPLLQSPIVDIDIDTKNFIATDELEESFDIVEEQTGRCIQVTTLSSGNILEQYYLPLKEMDYKASGKVGKGHLLIETLDEHTHEFLNVSSEGITINPLSGFVISQNTLMFNDNENVVVMTQGTFQIMIEMSEVPNHLIDIPKLIREKSFLKESGKIFASIMLPMLLLLFVDLAPEKKKPLKTLSIIYKNPTKSKVDNKNLTSKVTTNENKNNGHKTTKQPEQKVSRNKAGQKSKKAPAKQVAKSTPVKSNKVKKAKAPVKAYQFKMASNINSLFKSGKEVKVSNNRAAASLSSESSLNTNLNTKIIGTSNSKAGNLGSDLAGTTASFGSKGLSSKKGLDSSYIQTKTVVLGSMDPELLRKILQRYLPQFRHCYQQELAYNDETIKGIVDLNFTIQGSGKVSGIDIKAKDNRFSKKGIDCMSNVLSIIDFPRPKGGGRVAVRQPLSFFSEQSKS